MELVYILSGVVGISILGMFVYLIYSDVRYQRLPNICIIILVILSFTFTTMSEVIIEQNSYTSVIIEHVLALLPISGLYLVIYIVSHGRLVGLGDVKLGIPIAILLPWQGALLTLAIANLMLFVIVLPLLITKKAKTNTKVPFAPFLIIACLIVFFGMEFFMNLF